MRAAIVACLLLLANAIKLSAYEFDKRTKPESMASPILIIFKTPRCPHCKAITPQWEKLVKDAHTFPDVRVAEVDCSSTLTLCQTHGIRGYPTVRLYTMDGEYKAAPSGAHEDARNRLTKFLVDELGAKAVFGDEYESSPRYVELYGGELPKKAAETKQPKSELPPHLSAPHSLHNLHLRFFGVRLGELVQVITGDLIPTSVALLAFVVSCEGMMLSVVWRKLCKLRASASDAE